MTLTSTSVIKAFVLLFLSIIAFICIRPLYNVISGMTSNTYLSAVMFIIFWFIVISVTYIPIMNTLENRGYLNEDN